MAEAARTVRSNIEFVNIDYFKESHQMTLGNGEQAGTCIRKKKSICRQRKTELMKKGEQKCS